jgi:hypothetical protein
MAYIIPVRISDKLKEMGTKPNKNMKTIIIPA